MLLGSCHPLGLEPMGGRPALWACRPWWVSAPGRSTQRAGCTKEDLLDPAGWSHGTSWGFSSGIFKSRTPGGWHLRGACQARGWPGVNVNYRRGWPGLLKGCLLACLPIQFEIILPSCPCLSPAQCPGQTFRAHRSFATPHTHPPSWRLGQHHFILPAQTLVPKGW